MIHLKRLGTLQLLEAMLACVFRTVFGHPLIPLPPVLRSRVRIGILSRALYLQKHPKRIHAFQGWLYSAIPGEL